MFFTNSETGEWARVLLEGGLTTTLEGLRDSGASCATRLSVAGFFACLGLFLLEKEVYSEVRRGLFPPPEASPLQHQC